MVSVSGYRDKKQSGDIADTVAKADCALISDLAREAGQIGLHYFGRNPKVWLKEGKSPVSEADFAVDNFLKKKLLAARPDYGWISEETKDDRPPIAYKRSFIVDPIDGTRGFIEGDRRWCVSIAVVEAGRPIAAVLECPALQEHYTAYLGGRALLNGELIGHKGEAETKKPENFAPDSWLVSCRKIDFQKLPPHFTQRAERAGHIPSLAYRLALLARGELTFVLARGGCCDWDIVAADLILRLSGGQLVTRAGDEVFYGREPFRHDFLFAAKEDNLKLMLDIVSACDLR